MKIRCTVGSSEFEADGDERTITSAQYRWLEFLERNREYAINVVVAASTPAASSAAQDVVPSPQERDTFAQAARDGK